jgi:glycosyltransferase involved in cell wall biosynthesis
MPSITALLPAYNERLQGSVVLRTKQYADRRSLDDGSSDRTAEVALLAGAVVLCHDEDLGKGAALKRDFACSKAILKIDANSK